MKKIVRIEEHKPASAENADDAQTRREAERRSIATRYHETLVRADVLRPLPPYGAPTLGDVAQHKGDPVPLVRLWAAVKYCDRPVPARKDMLADWREQYGTGHGVTEHTMRIIRGELATPQQKKGGRPPQP